ncbi:MAG: metallopeptidase TldD-related protein [Proteobacteria bacterium]|nr:metallopeptidase TldD-related protein [Pseudomonadota bacterium]
MSERLDRVIQLVAREVDELVAVERQVERAHIERVGGRERRRRVARRDIDLSLFRDIGRGRGWARVSIAEAVPDLESLLRRAVQRAARAVGPGWGLPPPSAAARVDIADPAMDSDVMTAADAIGRSLDEPIGSGFRVGSLAIVIERGRTDIRTSRGLTHGHSHTLLTIEAMIALAEGTSGVVERLHVQSRQLAALDLPVALSRAVQQLDDRNKAILLVPGRYDLVVARDALVPRNVGYGRALVADFDAAVFGERPARYGWFEPIVAQADARADRIGLTRYRPGQLIYGDRVVTGDPLTVVSDGTVPFGLLSRPLGDLGEPVRRFVIIERGTATDLAFDLREAALRGVTANGGLSNLVIAPGTLSPGAMREPVQRPVVEVADLRWLDIDSSTGMFTAELGLSYLHDGSRDVRPVRGGFVHGNIFDYLPAIRLSSRTKTHSWYLGPESMRLSDVTVA